MLLSQCVCCSVFSSFTVYLLSPFSQQALLMMCKVCRERERQDLTALILLSLWRYFFSSLSSHTKLTRVLLFFRHTALVISVDDYKLEKRKTFPEKRKKTKEKHHGSATFLCFISGKCAVFCGWCLCCQLNTCFQAGNRHISLVFGGLVSLSYRHHHLSSVIIDFNLITAQNIC